jgi:hypothetical protein
MAALPVGAGHSMDENEKLNLEDCWGLDYFLPNS